jgi:hypothetical protein
MVTKYRNRSDSEQEWSKSDEKCLGEPAQQLQCSLSLGNTRQVQLRRVAMEWVRDSKPRKRSRSILDIATPASPVLQQVVKSTTDLYMTSGDLLFFNAPSLRCYQQRICEGVESERGVRITFTARNVVSDAIGRRQLSASTSATGSSTPSSSGSGSGSGSGKQLSTPSKATKTRSAPRSSTSTLSSSSSKSTERKTHTSVSAMLTSTISSGSGVGDDDDDASDDGAGVARFGEIPGYPPGTVVTSAGELFTTGLHRQPRKSISTSAGLVESLKLSANPFRTVVVDNGDVIIYTVEMRERDHELTIGGEMLQNYNQTVPIRVVQKVPTPRYLPSSYRYLGLYRVDRYTTAQNPNTNLISYNFYLHKAPISPASPSTSAKTTPTTPPPSE